MTNLSVNINKVATIRNARGGNMPDVLKVAQDAEAFGAQGITVHPRPDERHIRYSDVYALKPLVKTEFNIEGYPCEKFIDLVLKVRPTQVTLVPDAPDAITSNAGWDVKENYSFLSDLVECFTSNGIRTSIFVGTDLANIEEAAKTDFSAPALETLTQELIGRHGWNAGKVFNSMRLALVGASLGPHVFDIMEILGKEETLARIEQACQKISSPKAV